MLYPDCITNSMLLEVFYTIVVAVGLYLLVNVFRKPPPLWNPEGMGLYGPGARRLGYLERLLALLGEQGIILLSNVLIMRSKVPLTESMMHHALTLLSQRHPILRMRLGKANGQFTYMKEMEDFRLDMNVSETGDWQEQLLNNFDAEKGPLCRVRLIPETSYDDGQQDGYPYQAACIFAFHHVITDGPSYTMLHSEFMDALHAILTSVKPSIEPMCLLPPIDAYIDSVESYSLIDTLRLNLVGMVDSFEFAARLMVRRSTKYPIFVQNLGVEIDRDRNVPYKTCIVPVELTKEETSELIAACRRHQVTVHSVIQTAACVAYVSMAYGGNVTETYKINAGPTSNLRPYIGSDELKSYFGPYFTSVSLTTEVGPTAQFWDIVTKVNSDLKDQLTSGKQFGFLRAIKTLVTSKALWDAFAETRRKLPSMRYKDIDFTNLGHLKYLSRDTTGHIKLTARFVCSAEHQQGSIFANNVVTFDGKLFWTFVYYPQVTSREQAQQYADLTLETLFQAFKL